MDHSPLVSVVCVSMNHEKFVERSFTSIVNQTFKDIEILYVDNNSIDNTFEISDKIFRDSAIPYKGFKRTENIGLSANLNFLLKLARGKYISVISGDDFFKLNNLEEKIKYYDAHPEFGMLYGSGYKYFYDTGETELIDTTQCKSGWVFKELLCGNFVNAIGTIIKRSTLDDVGLFDENSKVEDWEMWIRIAEKYPIGFLDKPLVYYGRTGRNISDNSAYMDEGADYIFQKYAHHSQIETAKKRYRLYRVYQHASAKPSLRNLQFILANFQFNPVYFKQVVKFCLNVLAFKK